MSELTSPSRHVWKPVAKNHDMAPAVVPGAVAQGHAAVRGAAAARAVWAEGGARGRAGGKGDAGAVAGGDQTGAADQAPADEPEAGGAGRGARGRGTCGGGTAGAGGWWGRGGWWEDAGGSGGKTRTWPLATWCGGGGWGGSNGKTRQGPYAYGAPAGRWPRDTRGRDRRGDGGGGSGTAARLGKPDKDPMPMECLPGASLGVRTAGIAAATEAGGSGGQQARVEELGRGPLLSLPPGTCPGGGAAAAGGMVGGLGSVGDLRLGGSGGQQARVEELGRGPLQRGAVAAGGVVRGSGAVGGFRPDGSGGQQARIGELGRGPLLSLPPGTCPGGGAVGTCPGGGAVGTCPGGGAVQGRAGGVAVGLLGEAGANAVAMPKLAEQFAPAAGGEAMMGMGDGRGRGGSVEAPCGACHRGTCPGGGAVWAGTGPHPRRFAPRPLPRRAGEVKRMVATLAPQSWLPI